MQKASQGLNYELFVAIDQELAAEKAKTRSLASGSKESTVTLEIAEQKAKTVQAETSLPTSGAREKRHSATEAIEEKTKELPPLDQVLAKMKKQREVHAALQAMLKTINEIPGAKASFKVDAASLSADEIDTSATEARYKPHTPLSYAVVKKSRHIVESLIKEGGAKVDAKDGNGKTALCHAIEADDAEMISILAANGADVNVNNIRVNTGSTFTPLGYAAYQGKISALRALIKAKADLNKTFYYDNENTALIVAAFHLKHDIVHELLLAGADPNQLMKAEKAALYWVLFPGSTPKGDEAKQLQVMKAFFETKGEAVIPLNLNRTYQHCGGALTLLDIAVELGLSSIVKYLLEKNPDASDLNTLKTWDGKGFAPLMRAVWKKDIKTVQAILDAAGRLITNSQVLHVAISAAKNSPEIMSLLLKHEALAELLEKIDFTQEDAGGNKVLQWDTPAINLVKELNEKRKFTPIGYAVYKNNSTELAKLLNPSAEHKEDKESQETKPDLSMITTLSTIWEGQKHCALTFAAEKGYVDVFCLLFDKIAKELTLELLHSAIAKAASNNHKAIVKKLLTHPNITKIDFEQADKHFDCRVLRLSTDAAELIRETLRNSDPLCKAVYANEYKTVATLIKESSPSINTYRNIWGSGNSSCCPIAFAAFRGYLEIVQVFVQAERERGLAACKMDVKSLHNAIGLAAHYNEKNHKAIIALLLTHPRIDEVNFEKDDGFSHHVLDYSNEGAGLVKAYWQKMKKQKSLTPFEKEIAFLKNLIEMRSTDIKSETGSKHHLIYASEGKTVEAASQNGKGVTAFFGFKSRASKEPSLPASRSHVMKPTALHEEASATATEMVEFSGAQSPTNGSEMKKEITSTVANTHEPQEQALLELRNLLASISLKSIPDEKQVTTLTSHLQKFPKLLTALHQEKLLSCALALMVSYETRQLDASFNPTDPLTKLAAKTDQLWKSIEEENLSFEVVRTACDSQGHTIFDYVVEGTNDSVKAQMVRTFLKIAPATLLAQNKDKAMKKARGLTQQAFDEMIKQDSLRVRNITIASVFDLWQFYLAWIKTDHQVDLIAQRYEAFANLLSDLWLGDRDVISRNTSEYGQWESSLVLRIRAFIRICEGMTPGRNHQFANLLAGILLNATQSATVDSSSAREKENKDAIVGDQLIIRQLKKDATLVKSYLLKHQPDLYAKLNLNWRLEQRAKELTAKSKPAPEGRDKRELIAGSGAASTVQTLASLSTTSSLSISTEASSANLLAGSGSGPLSLSLATTTSQLAAPSETEALVAGTDQQALGNGMTLQLS